jgi:hypothetical protein
MVTFQLVNNCVFGRAFFSNWNFIYLFSFLFQKFDSSIRRGLISTAGEKKKRYVRSANKCLSTALPAAILFLFFYRPRVKQHSSSSPIFLQRKKLLWCFTVSLSWRVRHSPIERRKKKVNISPFFLYMYKIREVALDKKCVDSRQTEASSCS